jgi:hypothetical protein
MIFFIDASGKYSDYTSLAIDIFDMLTSERNESEVSGDAVRRSRAAHDVWCADRKAADAGEAARLFSTLRLARRLPP